MESRIIISSRPSCSTCICVCHRFCFGNKNLELVDASKIQFSVVPVKEKELVSADADSTNYTCATLKPAEFERVLIALIHCAYLVQCSFKKLQMKQCF